ncbi:MAG: FKBP-type peptidyl-prolyl cis-trans isomerase [Vicinamibacterales bacterium]
MSRLVPVLCVAALVATLAATAACGGNSPTSPSTGSAPFSATDLTVGTGAEAVVGSRVTVNYTGWLYDTSASENKGRQFDTSAGRGPLGFTVGGGGVIRGWDQGVVGMKVGGRRRLVIPPELAYGSTGAGNGVIPPNATLVFDIELLSVS